MKRILIKDTGQGFMGVTAVLAFVAEAVRGWSETLVFSVVTDNLLSHSLYHGSGFFSEIVSNEDSLKVKSFNLVHSVNPTKEGAEEHSEEDRVYREKLAKKHLQDKESISISRNTFNYLMTAVADFRKSLKSEFGNNWVVSPPAVSEVVPYFKCLPYQKREGRNILSSTFDDGGKRIGNRPFAVVVLPDDPEPAWKQIAEASGFPNVVVYPDFSIDNGEGGRMNAGPSHLVALLSNENCARYIGQGWTSHIAWSLGVRSIVQFTEAVGDELWTAVQDPSVFLWNKSIKGIEFSPDHMKPIFEFHTKGGR